jgi:hypothetical protein
VRKAGVILRKCFISGLVASTLTAFAVLTLVLAAERLPLEKFIEDYQTLIAAFIALFAAWWTIETMKQQMSGERQRHRELIQRKSMAARAQMPDALAELTAFARACFKFLKGDEEFPAYPLEAISVFKNSIEFIDTPSAEKIFEMVSFYQVHNSRLQSYRPVEGPYEYQDRMYDLIRLNYLFMRIFEYARNQTPAITDTIDETMRDNMLHSLRSLVGNEAYMMHPERYEDLKRIVEERHPSS